MVFDAALSRVVLVGGCSEYGPTGDCGYLTSGIWEYFNGSWVSEVVSPPYQQGTCYLPLIPGNPCGPIIDPQIAYDPMIESVVLFGGFIPVVNVITDQTWILAPGATDGNPNYGPIAGFIHPTATGAWGTWMNFTSYLSSSPPVRSDGSMVYDAKDGYLLMFGGCSDPPIPFGQCAPTLSDTWTFTASGGSFAWTQVTSQLTPASRAGGAMAYFPPAQSVFLVGGLASPGSVLSDVWTFAGGQWSQFGTAPFALWDMGIVWDPVDQELVVSSGYGPGYNNCANQWYGVCAGTWTYDQFGVVPNI